MREFKEQLETLRGEADRAERDGDLAKAAELRYGRIPEVEKKPDAALPQAQVRESVMLKEQVGPDDIADVVAARTGIPAGRLMEGETAKLLRMEDELGRRVVGQKRAVAAVSDAVRRTRAGVADPNRPTGCSCSSAPPVSERPNWPRRWRTSCSTMSDGPHRHERVRRETLGGPPGRCASGLHRLRPGRSTD